MPPDDEDEEASDGLPREWEVVDDADTDSVAANLTVQVDSELKIPGPFEVSDPRRLDVLYPEPSKYGGQG